MIPYFDTYHWSKNIIYKCQNTIQDYKIVFDILFLTTLIRVALNVTILIEKRDTIFMENLIEWCECDSVFMGRPVTTNLWDFVTKYIIIF